MPLSTPSGAMSAGNIVASSSSRLIGCSGRTNAKIGYGFSTTPMPALRLKSSNGSYESSPISSTLIGESFRGPELTLVSGARYYYYIARYE